MSLHTIDVVMSLPGPLHDNALSASALLVERMRAHGHPSTFQLGRPIAGPRDGGL